MGDGQRGRNGATARRASTPDDGWRRGRTSDPAKVGGGENFMVASLHLCSACFCEKSLRKESYGGEKKVISRRKWEISR